MVQRCGSMLRKLTALALLMQGVPSAGQAAYTLQLLHFSDAEAGLLASRTAPNLAAIADRLEDLVPNSLTLAGGDDFIPGPFLAGGTDTAIAPALNRVLNTTVTAATTIPIALVDFAIHNLIGVEGSAIGNHDFDLGSNVLATAIAPASGFRWSGAQFPLISANLDFSGDAALNARFNNTVPLATTPTADALDTRVAPSAIIVKGGERIGLVGATTQILKSISSPSGTEIRGFEGQVGRDDMPLLASQLQPVINDLISEGVNKIILLSHLQQLQNEISLAPLLTGVDIIIAAGSHTRLGDSNDVPVDFPGHAANFLGLYPIRTSGANGDPVLIVCTDNEYTYLGRLVVGFNAAGVIDLSTLNETTNGAIASTEANVARLWGIDAAQVPTVAFANGTRGNNVKTLTDAVQSVIDSKTRNVFGYTRVYLEGERNQVRGQETNLGDLTADANNWAAQRVIPASCAVRSSRQLYHAYDSYHHHHNNNKPVTTPPTNTTTCPGANQTYFVSLKNGGGIRAQIGAVSPVNPDGSVTKLPPPNGTVSQLDVENALRFNNGLMVVDVNPAGLKALLEHGVAAGTGQGRFPQIGGVSFSYDPQAAAGSRVRDVALSVPRKLNLYDDGLPIPGTADVRIALTILNFLANGGDGYPTKANGENFRYLLYTPNATNVIGLSGPVNESLDFTASGVVPANILGEQTALELFMRATHPTNATAYNQPDTPEANDTRIQNIRARQEDVLALPEGVLQVLAVSIRALKNCQKLHRGKTLKVTIVISSINLTPIRNVALQVRLPAGAMLEKSWPYPEEDIRGFQTYTFAGLSVPGGVGRDLTIKLEVEFPRHLRPGMQTIEASAYVVDACTQVRSGQTGVTTYSVQLMK